MHVSFDSCVAYRRPKNRSSFIRAHTTSTQLKNCIEKSNDTTIPKSDQLICVCNVCPFYSVVFYCTKIKCYCVQMVEFSLLTIYAWLCASVRCESFRRCATVGKASTLQYSSCIYPHQYRRIGEDDRRIRCHTYNISSPIRGHMEGGAM